MFLRSTSYKNILANNSDVEEFKHQLPMEYGIHHPGVLKQYNLLHLSQYNRTDILYRLEHYFKFMVARHPFTRLVSAYKDKMRGDNLFYRKYVHEKILTKLRPGFNITTATDEGATFSEFIQYYIQYGIKDVHFSLLELNCHPCQIQYDYIAKLETHEYDMDHIINTKLSGYGDPSLNAHGTTSTAALTQILPEFSNATLQQISAIKQQFRFGMQMFGYSINYHDDGLKAHCGGSDSQPNNCC